MVPAGTPADIVTLLNQDQSFPCQAGGRGALRQGGQRDRDRFAGGVRRVPQAESPTLGQGDHDGKYSRRSIPANHTLNSPSTPTARRLVSPDPPTTPTP